MMLSSLSFLLLCIGANAVSQHGQPGLVHRDTGAISCTLDTDCTHHTPGQSCPFPLNHDSAHPYHDAVVLYGNGFCDKGSCNCKFLSQSDLFGGCNYLVHSDPANKIKQVIGGCLSDGNILCDSVVPDGQQCPNSTGSHGAGCKEDENKVPPGTHLC